MVPQDATQIPKLRLQESSRHDYGRPNLDLPVRSWHEVLVVCLCFPWGDSTSEGRETQKYQKENDGSLLLKK